MGLVAIERAKELTVSSDCYHLIGLGGIGMSALARIFLQRGWRVSGTDCQDSEQLRTLQKMGAQIFISHSDKQIESLPSNAKVVYSSSIAPDNVERLAAEKRQLPLFHRAEILHQLATERVSYGVSGTHGKSSTSALLAWLLMCAEKTSFALGALLKPQMTNGRWREKGPLVIEIDESDGRSFGIPLQGGILTNLSKEHLNHWKSLKGLQKGFSDWVNSLKKRDLFIFCADDPMCQKIAQGSGFSYGFSKSADYRIHSVLRSGWKMTFDLAMPGNRVLSQLTLPLLGTHQVLNAAGALALADRLGIKMEKLRNRLESFKGLCRRGEFIGEWAMGQKQLAHFDDYAHHPVEVSAFLQSLRQAIGDQRLTVIFQPHRFTRLRDCFADYLNAFDRADCLVLCPVYPASEKPISGIDSSALAKQISLRIASNQTIKSAKSIRLEDVLLWRGLEDDELVRFRLMSGGVVCTLGAGDINQLSLRWLRSQSGE